MNLWRLLLLPWQVTGRVARWAALVLGVAALLGASAFVLFSQQNDVWVRAAGIVGLAQAMVWMFMTNLVLITIDAHQLRLPGITRDVVLGVAVNMVLAVLLPALLIGAFAGHGFAVAVIIALLSTAGLLHNLLPRYVGLVLYVAWLMMIMNWVAILRPIQADFLLWALSALALVVAAVAVCWRRLVITAKPLQVSRNSPPALRLRRMMATASGGRRAAQRFDGRAGWFQTRVDLRRCGPGQPVLSLRMALGGDGMPQTFIGWLQQSIFVVVLAVLVAVWLLVVNWHDSTPTWAGHSATGVALLLACAAGTYFMFALIRPLYLAARWHRANAELPLLALLPKLGDHVKRDLLLAALWPALRALLLAALLMTVMAGVQPRRAIAVFAALSIATALGYALAFTLRTLGGDSSGRWSAAVAGIFGLLLWLFGLFAAVIWFDAGSAAQAADVWWRVLLVGWLVEAVMLVRLGFSGWQALRRRPHPFLVNSDGR